MERIFCRLSPAVMTILARIAALAASMEMRVFLVGGAVRDLLLGKAPSKDLDLAVEGDAAALAERVAATLGGEVIAVHAAFGTATVAIGQVELDLARTRTERYIRPAALPEVEPATIIDDLRRRDVTVNAVAIPLAVDADGRLIEAPPFDPFGGAADLAARRLRLLHDASVRDDPTRILRAVRLAARLGLTPDAATAAQIGNGLRAGYLALLTPDRVLGELCLAVDEPDPAAVVAVADAWGVTPHVVPSLRWTPALAERMARLKADPFGLAAHAPVRLARVAALLADLSDGELRTVAARYPLPAAMRDLISVELISARAALPAVAAAATPSAVDAVLARHSVAALTALCAATPDPALAERLARYVRDWRTVRAPLDGNDLRAMGVKPGREMGALLRDLRAATLDGMISCRTDAEAWVRQRIGG